MTTQRTFLFKYLPVTVGNTTVANQQREYRGVSPQNRDMTQPKRSKKSAQNTRSGIAVLDVLFMGTAQAGGEELSARQVADAASAFSSIGQVFHQPAGAAVVHHEGRTYGMLAHRLRIHIPHDQVLKALDTVHSYRELVLPDAFVFAEIANITVVAL